MDGRLSTGLIVLLDYFFADEKSVWYTIGEANRIHQLYKFENCFIFYNCLYDFGWFGILRSTRISRAY